MSRYDHPNNIVTRETYLGLTTAGNGGISAYWAPYQKCVVKFVIAQVKIAGTSAGAGAKVDIKHGTTSIGSITLATNTINQISTATLNETMTGGATDYLAFTNGTDASSVVALSLVWQVLPDAVQPA